MGRVVAVALAVVILIVGFAFVVQACAPYGASQGPGVEVDVDLPKKHRKDAPKVSKAPKFRKSR